MKHSEFPRMVYKQPGLEEIHGDRYETKIVDSDDELIQAESDGFFKTTQEAKEARSDELAGRLKQSGIQKVAIVDPAKDVETPDESELLDRADAKEPGQEPDEPAKRRGRKVKDEQQDDAL